MIRGADDRDTEAIVALEESAFGGAAWSAALVEGELIQGDAVVVEVDGRLAGWAAVRGEAVADLTRIAVDPEARHRGLGRALLAEALGLAARRGAERILLEVAATNAPAVALYSAAGFVEISRRRDYYGPGVDALVLELAPIDGRATLDA